MGEIGLNVPYVRQARSGFYWEPSRKLKALGFSAEALGKDAAAALKRAKELNKQVRIGVQGDDAVGGTALEGSVAWAIIEYRRSEEWKAKAESTKRGYRQALDRVEAWAGDKRVEAITRKAVKVWYREMAATAPSYAAATIRVLRIVLHFAKDEGYKIADLGQLRLHTPGGNSEPWEAWEISAYADEAIRMGRRSMALALMLGVCLGQREGDVIRLPRSAYDPATRTITLRQRKTKKPLAVPVLPELRREIELAPVRGIQLVISEQTGRPYKEDNFRHIHRDICQAAGIADARWFMHLRHTAATRLGEAGCADDLIRAITGHRDRGVVARYVQPTDAMAKAAIGKLVEHRARKPES